MRLYRYRSIEKALQEIEDGTFYFASREELNDPAEGYVRVFWKGDKAAWEGLFRNYIYSVMWAISSYQLASDEATLQEKTVVWNMNAFNAVPFGKILEELGEKFLIRPVH